MTDETRSHPPTDDTARGADEAHATRTFTEEFRVSGEKVVETVKELIREGNVRRITLKNDEGKTLIEIPLTLGVIGTLLLPVWAGIGAIAALVANLTIAVERSEPIGPSDARVAPATSEPVPDDPPA